MKDKHKYILVGLLSFFVLGVLYLILSFFNMGSVKITSNPTNAEVYGIKNAQCVSPCSLRLSVGKQRIWVTKDGYELATKDVEVKRFKKTTVDFKLEKAEIYEGPEEDSQEVKEPEINDLPYQATNFRVDWSETEEKYLIIPNIDMTQDEELTMREKMASQWTKYVQYANEALAWIKTQGVTPTQENIEWWAQEYWPDGASIEIK